MYLSIVLYMNLFAIFSQTQAQPLRHHLSLHYSTHQHHMHLHHHLSGSKLSPSEDLGPKTFRHVPQDHPLPSPRDPGLPYDQDSSFHTLLRHDEHLTIRDEAHTGADP
ncbi:hypothetical protein ABVK25_006091 [Lepraria finkii]|uniref:Uncharacterized protein n=1 Tax=Lepraria finkii TaxID=1340010 RepID=A0ABR4B7E9_9LECA